MEHDEIQCSRDYAIKGERELVSTSLQLSEPTGKMTYLVTLAVLMSVVWAQASSQLEVANNMTSVHNEHCYRGEDGANCPPINKHRGILLIGSTGNGKSTLGNFLLDPSEEGILGEKQTFPRAGANLPKTLNVSHVSLDVRYEGGNKSLPITVIDTPGLNEDDAQDLKHMIQIVETLHSANGSEVSACVLVVKFDSKIDAQYKATVKYYRQLLPQLFEKNVIIVMTMFGASVRAERERELRGIDTTEIKKNVIKEIMDSGKLQFEPMIFMINGLPLTDEDISYDLKQRDAILGYTSTLSPISTAKLHVAKTARIKDMDNASIAKIDGKIEGYNNRLIELNKSAEDTLVDYKEKNMRVTQLKSELQNVKDNLNKHNSSETVPVKSWSISSEWRFLQWLSEKFDVSAPCEITNVVKWTNGHSHWKHVEQYYDGVRGILEGDFMRGMYAELRLETTMRIKYATEIKAFRTEHDRCERDLNEAKQELRKVESSNVQYNKEIESLKAYIKKDEEEKERCMSEYMTLDEAYERLKILIR